MGQYYLTVNKTKKQYLNPHKFGSGLKLMEFSGDQESIMQGLAILLASGNGRGGGDLRSNDPIVGSWAGDEIVVAGDYGDDGLFTDGAKDGMGKEYNLYGLANAEFEDVSDAVIGAITAAEGSMSRLSKLNLESDGWR